MDERERIRRFVAHAKTPLPPGSLGPGADDAAVLPLAPGDDLVASTDLATEGVQFFADSSPVAIGRFVAAINLSDLAAMGARPVGFLAAYAQPPGADPAWLDAVAQGVAEMLDAHACPLLGGDTKEAPVRFLAGTALGSVPRGQALGRDGVVPGDRLVLTGPVGGPAARLAERASSKDVVLRRHLADRLLDVHPRIAAGVILREAGAHAAVDLSDGLARAAVLVADASGCAVEVDAAAVPVAAEAQARTGSDWASSRRGRRLVVGTGGEYELLAAVAPRDLERLLGRLRALDLTPAVVGTASAGKGARLLSGAASFPLDPLGWRHFA